MENVEVGSRKLIRRIKKEGGTRVDGLILMFWDAKLYELFEELYYWIYTLALDCVVIDQSYCQQIKGYFNLRRINVLFINDRCTEEFKRFTFRSEV